MGLGRLAIWTRTVGDARCGRLTHRLQQRRHLALHLCEERRDNPHDDGVQVTVDGRQVAGRRREFVRGKCLQNLAGEDCQGQGVQRGWMRCGHDGAGNITGRWDELRDLYGETGYDDGERTWEEPQDSMTQIGVPLRGIQLGFNQRCELSSTSSLKRLLALP